jgi:hypothetical protein
LAALFFFVENVICQIPWAHRQGSGSLKLGSFKSVKSVSRLGWIAKIRIPIRMDC